MGGGRETRGSRRRPASGRRLTWSEWPLATHGRVPMEAATTSQTDGQTDGQTRTQAPVPAAQISASAQESTRPSAASSNVCLHVPAAARPRPRPWPWPCTDAACCRRGPPKRLATARAAMMDDTACSESLQRLAASCSVSTAPAPCQLRMLCGRPTSTRVSSLLAPWPQASRPCRFTCTRANSSTALANLAVPRVP